MKNAKEYQEERFVEAYGQINREHNEEEWERMKAVYELGFKQGMHYEKCLIIEKLSRHPF